MLKMLLDQALPVRIITRILPESPDPSASPFPLLASQGLFKNLRGADMFRHADPVVHPFAFAPRRKDPHGRSYGHLAQDAGTVNCRYVAWGG